MKMPLMNASVVGACWQAIARCGTGVSLMITGDTPAPRIACQQAPTTRWRRVIRKQGVLLLLANALYAEPPATPFIDADFPGGNIVVEKIGGDDRRFRNPYAQMRGV